VILTLLDKLLPSAWARWAIVLVVLTATHGAAYVRGLAHEAARCDAAAAQQEVLLLKAVERAARIQDRVIYRTVDRWRTVVEKGETIVREVPTYVTVESDRRCVVPVGFARVHDAAANNSVLPAPAGAADAADSEIALSAVGTTVAANYQRYYEVRAMCEGLQAWARELTHTAPQASDP
jgi:hypothetical protein